jgi:hypothetical protein
VADVRVEDVTLDPLPGAVGPLADGGVPGDYASLATWSADVSVGAVFLTCYDTATGEEVVEVVVFGEPGTYSTSGVLVPGTGPSLDAFFDLPGDDPFQYCSLGDESATFARNPGTGEFEEQTAA